MGRIVVDCSSKGCQRQPRWALIGFAGTILARSCDPHLSSVARYVALGSDKHFAIELQHI